MKRSIKSVDPCVWRSLDLLVQATEAHQQGYKDDASQLFREADSDEVWRWLHPAWFIPIRNVVHRTVSGDTIKVARSDRDPDRRIHPTVRHAVLARDGYTCRYCGVGVVPVEVRNLVFSLYPLVRSVKDRPHRNHAAFDALWLQYDHVVPHCHGGPSSPENVVISCGLCNYGKDQYTLAQLDLEDPRMRDPVASAWDGLTRLLPSSPLATVPAAPRFRPTTTKRSSPQAAPLSANGDDDAPRRAPDSEAYFLPGGWIGRGYVFTPVLEGKERWFKLTSRLNARATTIAGVDGVLVDCGADALVRRGMKPALYRLKQQSPTA